MFNALLIAGYVVFFGGALISVWVIFGVKRPRRRTASHLSHTSERQAKSEHGEPPDPFHLPYNGEPWLNGPSTSSSDILFRSFRRRPGSKRK